METAAAGDLLREVRSRHGLTREALAIRATVDPALVSDIETGEVSPRVATLSEFLELLGEDLVLAAEDRLTGIDLTLNRGNLELTSEQRVLKGLAFADFVRRHRSGNTVDLGRSLQPGPIFLALARQDVEFVVIGSIAGLTHGSAYPTYDLDLACEDRLENLTRLASALGELGVHLDIDSLSESPVLPFRTEFGSLDVVRRVPGVESYEQLRRNATMQTIAGFEVPVASLNHLIAMKRASGQRKDLLMAMEYIELADEIRRRAAEDDEG